MHGRYANARAGAHVPAAAPVVVVRCLRAHATRASACCICALSCALALLQDSQSLAVVAFLGGFATPVLLSTGGGSHVALFSYYLLLSLSLPCEARRSAPSRCYEPFPPSLCHFLLMFSTHISLLLLPRFNVSFPIDPLQPPTYLCCSYLDLTCILSSLWIPTGRPL